MSEKVILTEEDIRRTLTRIAHEIVEHNYKCDGIIFVGLHTRGAPLAQRIADNIEQFEKVHIPVGALEIGPYRDDVSPRQALPALRPTIIPTDISGKCVVLVDDVIYTGRSIRAAMDAIIDFGRPRTIQLAVLVDRGHRELPIRADYVGKNVPTSRDEKVEVRLFETDGRDEVTIIKPVREPQTTKR